MVRLVAAELNSVVSIAGLEASQQYLIMVESRSSSGFPSAWNSSISVTTEGVVGLGILSGTLLAVLAAVVFVTLLVCIGWRSVCA